MSEARAGHFGTSHIIRPKVDNRLKSFEGAPFNQVMINRLALHLKIAGQDPVSVGHFGCEFVWNDDFTAYRTALHRWNPNDPNSYALYQAGYIDGLCEGGVPYGDLEDEAAAGESKAMEAVAAAEESWDNWVEAAEKAGEIIF